MPAAAGVCGECGAGPVATRISSGRRVAIVAAVVGILLLAAAVIRATGADESDRDDVAVQESVPSEAIEPAGPPELCTEDLSTVLEGAWLPGATFDEVYRGILIVYGASDPRTQVLTQVFSQYQSDVYQLGAESASAVMWQNVIDWCDRNGGTYY